MIDCSVGIVTYNSARTIASTLQALRRHWPPELSGHIYVVDNGSTDQTQALIQQAASEDDRFLSHGSIQPKVNVAMAPPTPDPAHLDSGSIC